MSALNSHIDTERGMYIVIPFPAEVLEGLFELSPDRDLLLRAAAVIVALPPADSFDGAVVSEGYLAGTLDVSKEEGRQAIERLFALKFLRYYADPAAPHVPPRYRREDWDDSHRVYLNGSLLDAVLKYEFGKLGKAVPPRTRSREMTKVARQLSVREGAPVGYYFCDDKPKRKAG